MAVEGDLMNRPKAVGGDTGSGSSPEGGLDAPSGRRVWSRGQPNRAAHRTELGTGTITRTCWGDGGPPRPRIASDP